MLRITNFLFASAVCLVSLATGIAQTSDQTTTAGDRQSVNITVYSSNLGLVRETRRLTLPSGRIALRFADVTAQIRPETVHRGSQTIEASYLTAGMNWRADYVLLVNADDTKGDLQGWVTLTNSSGATFEDARLQLVAGDVNRVSEERNYALAGAMQRKAIDSV